MTELDDQMGKRSMKIENWYIGVRHRLRPWRHGFQAEPCGSRYAKQPALRATIAAVSVWHADGSRVRYVGDITVLV